METGRPLLGTLACNKGRKRRLRRTDGFCQRSCSGEHASFEKSLFDFLEIAGVHIKWLPQMYFLIKIISF